MGVAKMDGWVLKSEAWGTSEIMGPFPALLLEGDSSSVRTTSVGTEFVGNLPELCTAEN